MRQTRYGVERTPDNPPDFFRFERTRFKFGEHLLRDWVAESPATRQRIAYSAVAYHIRRARTEWGEDAPDGPAWGVWRRTPTTGMLKLYRRPVAPSPVKDPMALFTPAECRVMDEYCDPRWKVTPYVEQVASNLGLSKHTVSRHLGSIYKKTGKNWLAGARAHYLNLKEQKPRLTNARGGKPLTG